MASHLVPVRPIGIRACAIPSPRRADPGPTKSSSNNWWAPLFGWSPEPDYIDSNAEINPPQTAKGQSESGFVQVTRRTRFSPGCFTEEKAKELRLRLTETESFHDAMYHSAIASRLASDFKNRSDL